MNELSFFIVIPANVVKDKSISANAKLIYGAISGLCREKGYCWATNEYLGEIFGHSVRSTQLYISELQAAGHILVEVVKNEQGTARKIYLSLSIGGMQNPAYGGMQNNARPGMQDSTSRHAESCMQNNIVYNTILENKNTLSEDKVNAEKNFRWFSEILNKAVIDTPREFLKTAGAFHKYIFGQIHNAGIRAEKEFIVPDGRIDIVAYLADGPVAIELDNVTPRGKSLLKLSNTTFKQVVILRNPNPHFDYRNIANTIDAIFLNKSCLEQTTSAVNVILPWETDSFRQAWEHWKAYKKKQHRFTYKSPESEQAALKKLAQDSTGREDIAVRILEDSMGNGYQGFGFPSQISKILSNGNTAHNQQRNSARATAESVHDELRRRYPEQPGQDWPVSDPF